MVDDFRPGQPQQPANEPTDKPDDFQATYENKPETYVTPTGEPTTLDEAPHETPAAVTKKKSSAGKLLLTLVVILLLAGLGALAYWQWTEADTAKKELSSKESQLQTAQSDLAKAKADAEKTSTPVASKPTDKELITTEVTDNAQAVKGSETAKLTVNILKQGTSFAYVSVGAQGAGGGYAVILKKVNSSWVIVYQGQDKVPAETVTKYAIPTEYQTGQ